MMEGSDETIAAISSPAGASPVAIVRLSGPEAFPIMERLLAETEAHGSLAAAPHYSARQAALRLRPGGPQVPATLYLMRAPRSYTRQDVAEIHTLGSPPLLSIMLDALVAGGARLAAPGEFTRRAFLNGRLDLSQAEAVLALIEARNAAELRAAARALAGRRSRRIQELHDDLVELRALVEAAIDFAQEDIELLGEDELLARVERAMASVNDELRNADSGALPPEGARVALCGLPNVGKSSLFNALLARDRAIVTPLPGTTRDAVAEPLTIQGLPFRLYDTAGIASACEAPEAPDAEAVARSLGLIAGTDIALVVLDGSRPLGESERTLWAQTAAPHKLLVVSKADLPQALGLEEAAALAGASPVLRTSALTGEGLAELAGTLANLVRGGAVQRPPSDLTWNARHRAALRGARAALRRAARAVRNRLGSEFVAADLRDAHTAIASITGQTTQEDILDVIFAQFCIGK